MRQSRHESRWGDLEANATLHGELSNRHMYERAVAQRLNSTEATTEALVSFEE